MSAYRCPVCDYVYDESAGAPREAFCAAVPRLHVLVNNAGGAKGTTSVMDADEDQWRWMWETNVLGTLRMVRGLMPVLVETGDGLVITITSIAAIESYDNGSGYTSAKHAQAVLHRTLRGEHLGQPVRFTEIAPGMVFTPEFTLNRLGGDQVAAEQVYDGVDQPLVASDVADVIAAAEKIIGQYPDAAGYSPAPIL